MAINRTDWQIIVQARTGQAQKAMAGLAAQAKTAEGAFQNFSNVQGTVTQQLKTTPRVFDKLTTQIKSGKLSMEQYGRVMKHTSAIVRRQNQLQNAAVAAAQRTDGAMSTTTATMQKFRNTTARLTQRIALANTATRAMATGMVDFGKNMQWAGRQIMVGFTVPFGIAMLAASKAFTDFEEEVIRFRKVFNDELGATTEEAEERVIKMANTMSRELGYARNDILETAATFAQMGKSVDEVERLTEATTRLSLLGEVPKETATQLIRAYAASGFDEAAGGIENVVNHLNALENSTSLTTEMMASSLPQIIPIFEQMNLQFGEGEAIIAGMTESLGSANQSVNALKMGLQRVYDPTQQAIDAFEDMGINLLAIRERNENDIIGFFGELGELMEGQIETNIEFADTIGNLFGVRRAGHLATALRSINDAQSDFARGMDVTMKSAAENAATADEEIAAQVESIGGRLKRLKESMLIEITEIGQMFLKMAMPFFEMLGDLLTRFNNLDEGTKKFILAIGALSGVFAGVIMMAGIFVNLVGMTIKAFTQLLPIIKLVTEEEVSMTAALKMYSEQSKASRIVMELREQQHRQNAAAMNAEAAAARGLSSSLSSIERPMVHGRPLIGPMMGEGVSGSSRAIEQGVQGRGAKIKWRRGAMLAGTVGMGASMLPGMSQGASQGIMAGSIGVEALAMLGGRGKGLKNIVSRMKQASAAAGSMTGKLGKGAAMARTLAAGLATSTGVIAAIAGGAFLIYKHVKNAKEEAAKLKNEFQLSDDIASDLGLELEKGAGSLSKAWGGQSVEDAEELSDSMKIVVDRVNELRGQDGGADKIQAIFRNMAREWLSGGATIEQVNEKLNELEAIVGVSIDEQSRETLRNNVSQDISDAINDALLNFSGDTSFWRSIWRPGQRFSFDDEENIRNSVQALMGGIQSAMGSEDGIADINAMIGEFYRTRQTAIGDDAEAIDEFNRVTKEAMNLRFNIPQEHAKDLDSIGETFSYVYSRLASDKDMLMDMSRQERDNLYELVEAYGAYELHVRNAGVSDEDFAESQADAAAAIMDAKGALGDLGDEALWVERDALGPLTSKYSDLVGLLGRGTGTEINDTIGRLQNLKVEWSDNAEMVAWLDTVIIAMQEHLSEGFIAPFEIIPRFTIESAGMAAGADRALTKGASITDETKDKIKDEMTEVGEDAAKSYISAFRSELDKRRDEIIDDILDQYDEQTKNILDGLEERHDEEAELLENAKDAEIEALEARKDAIDEYIDKQNDLEDALNKQLDLILAIAGGEVDKAAQLQNEMMFQGVEEVAEAEKENIDRQIDGKQATYEVESEQLEATHEQRMKQEEEYRDAQRDTLEEQLEKTKDIFIGTKAGWNKFLGEVESTAGRFDTTINTGLMAGYERAMDQIVSDARLDHLWDGADFSTLRDRLAHYITDGVDKGFREGMDEVVPQVGDRTGRAVGGGVNKGLNNAPNTVYDGWMNRLEGYSSAGIKNGIVLGLSEVDKLWYEYLDSKNTADRKFFESAPEDSFGSFVSSKMKFHSGGRVPGKGADEVPAVLQTGEYVVQRNAVNTLGVGFLDQLNSYHDGGFVKGMGRQLGRMMGGMMYTDPEPSRGMSSLVPTGAPQTKTLQPPDADRTWRYSNWMVNMVPNVIEKFATALANLPGGQTVTSAYRSPAENRAIGGVPGSDHTKGKGVDFVDQSSNSLSNLNRMGQFFQNRSGVRWVGMPATDPTGGHNDHVHVSYYHGGGPVSLMKGGKVLQDNTLANLHKGELVLRKPISKALEDGIDRLNRGDSGVSNHFEFNFENFNGTPAEARNFAREVEQVLDRAYRRKNPTRSIR